MWLVTVTKLRNFELCAWRKHSADCMADALNGWQMTFALFGKWTVSILRRRSASHKPWGVLLTWWGTHLFIQRRWNWPDCGYRQNEATLNTWHCNIINKIMSYTNLPACPYWFTFESHCNGCQSDSCWYDVFDSVWSQGFNADVMI